MMRTTSWRSYKISGVPICENGKLVGIITNRDLRFMTEADFDQKISDVMTKENLVTAPVGTTLKRGAGDPPPAPH